MMVSNERTQGQKRLFGVAFPWVRLRFDRHFASRVNLLRSQDGAFRRPAVLNHSPIRDPDAVFSSASDT